MKRQIPFGVITSFLSDKYFSSSKFSLSDKFLSDKLFLSDFFSKRLIH